MVKDNPYSFLHIDKAEIDLPKGTDIYSDEVYRKAKENLENLEKTGALIQDKKPCFYIYRQIMNGRSQTGIVGCASIDDYMNNVIKARTHSAKKKRTVFVMLMPVMQTQARFFNISQKTTLSAIHFGQVLTRVFMIIGRRC